MDLAFGAAKRYCDANGMKIMNATRGGRSEIFERIDFDKINGSDQVKVNGQEKIE